MCDIIHRACNSITPKYGPRYIPTKYSPETLGLWVGSVRYKRHKLVFGIVIKSSFNVH